MELKELYNFKESLSVFNERTKTEDVKIYFDHKRKCFYYSVLDNMSEQLMFEESVQLVLDEKDFERVDTLTENEFKMNVQFKINSFKMPESDLKLVNKELEDTIKKEQESLLLSEKVWVTETTTSVKMRLLPAVKVFLNENGKLLGYVRLDNKVIRRLEQGKCFVVDKIKERRTTFGWGIGSELDNEEVKEMFKDLETDFYFVHLDIDEERRVFEYVFFDKETEKRELVIEIKTVEEMKYFTEIILSCVTDIFIDNYLVLFENTFR